MPTTSPLVPLLDQPYPVPGLRPAAPRSGPLGSRSGTAAQVDRVLCDTALRRYFEGVELRTVRSTVTEQAESYARTQNFDPHGPDGSLYDPRDVERIRAHFATGRC